MKKAAQGFHEGQNEKTSPSENCEMPLWRIMRCICKVKRKDRG